MQLWIQVKLELAWLFRAGEATGNRLPQRRAFAFENIARDELGERLGRCGAPVSARGFKMSETSLQSWGALIVEQALEGPEPDDAGKRDGHPILDESVPLGRVRIPLTSAESLSIRRS